MRCVDNLKKSFILILEAAVAEGLTSDSLVEDRLASFIILPLIECATSLNSMDDAFL